MVNAALRSPATAGHSGRHSLLVSGFGADVGPLVLNEPVVIAPVCVADDVVEDDKPLEFVLEVGRGLVGQGLTLEAAEQLVRVLVALYKRLEGADLKGEKMLTG